MPKRKNFIKVLIFTIVISTINLRAVYGATNPYQPTSRFGTNCTWYAWKNAYEKGGVALPGWGDAKTWADYATKAGFEVGEQPKSNSIMVIPNLTNWGHVVYVEKVIDGNMYVWDTGEPCHDNTSKEYEDCVASTYDPETDMYDANARIACYENAPLAGCPVDARSGIYIYLDSKPKTPTNPTPNEGTSTNNTAKSNNANLKSLVIKDIELEFKKDTLEYELTVKENVEKINIEATPEDKKAKVEGIGEKKLEMGLNTFPVIVTAQDGTKKTYNLKITKKDSNAYLKSLTLSAGNIQFQKDVFEYEIKVKNKVKSVTIEATSESKNATIEGIDTYDLKEGNNIINIVVTAEDDSKNTYVITINRENKIVLQNEKDSNLKYIVSGTILGVTLIILTITIMIHHTKVKKKQTPNQKKEHRKTKK